MESVLTPEFTNGETLSLSCQKCKVKGIALYNILAL
jgi:hypothetical protein